MEDEDIAGVGQTGLSRSEQMMQYGMLAGYFIAVYLLCYLVCRLINWNRLGKWHAAVQGVVLLAIAAALYMLWGLHFARLEDEYDLVKAAGLGFLTFFVAIGGSFHGEHGRLKANRRKGLTTQPAVEELPVGEPDAAAEI